VEFLIRCVLALFAKAKNTFSMNQNDESNTNGNA
jgi:hypothetical protein